MQHLADKYSVTITRAYGAARHRKSNSAMSRSGVNIILFQSIITNDWWFENSLDICSHITAHYSK